MRNEIIYNNTGLNGVYVRISKNLARKMYKKGYYIMVLGCRMLRDKNFMVCLNSDEDFDKIMNAWEYYNKSYEGYPMFFVNEYDYNQCTGKVYEY